MLTLIPHQAYLLQILLKMFLTKIHFLFSFKKNAELPFSGNTAYFAMTSVYFNVTFC